MKYRYSLLLFSMLLFVSCIKEDRSHCPQPNTNVFVRIVGDYTIDNLKKIDLWVERKDHSHWLLIKNYSIEEIGGKEYIVLSLPTGYQYNLVAIGNAGSATTTIAPLPQNCDCNDAQIGYLPSDYSTVGYTAHPNISDAHLPIDNLFMSKLNPLNIPPQSNANIKMDLPIDNVVSLVRLVVNTGSLTGQQVKVSIYNTSSGLKFDATPLTVKNPVYQTGIITGKGYILNTLIFPSLPGTSDINLLIEITNSITGEIISFRKENLHIAAKEIYIITFDGIQFNISAEDWNGNIDFDSSLT